MTTFTFTPLVDGLPDNASDVNTPLTALQTVLNGNLDTNNLTAAAAIKGTQLATAAAIADTQLASPNNSTQKTVLSGGGYVGGGAVGTYAVQPTGAFMLNGSATTNNPPSIFYFVTADHAVASKTTSFKLNMQVAVGATSPSTVTFTTGLYPLTVVAGNYTIGSAVASSTVVSSGLTTNTISSFTSSAFTALSTTTPYVIGLLIGSITSPAGISVNLQLARSNV